MRSICIVSHAPVRSRYDSRHINFFFISGERPFQCEVCKNGYVSKASLKIHMRTHTNERPFVCDFCGKAFRQSGDLTSHKRLHGTEKPIECSVCQKRYIT